MNLFKTTITAIIALFIAGCRSSNSTEHIPPVTEFNPEKYLGTWYEIARMPHDFEKNMTHVKAHYQDLGNGKIKVLNSGLRNGKKTSIQGVAVSKGKKNLGELKVSFFRPFYGDYKIIWLEKDYSVAIVTSSNTHYLWILARQKTIPKETLEHCLDKIKNWGFNTKQIEYTIQDDLT